jgi:hypothetical protein
VTIKTLTKKKTHLFVLCQAFFVQPPIHPYQHLPYCLCSLPCLLTKTLKYKINHLNALFLAAGLFVPPLAPEIFAGDAIGEPVIDDVAEPAAVNVIDCWDGDTNSVFVAAKRDVKNPKQLN